KEFIYCLEVGLTSDQEESILRMIKECSLRSDLEKCFGKDLEQFSLNALIEKLKNEAIPDELFATLIEEHHERFQKKEREFQEVAEKIREQFISLVETSVANGLFPERIVETLNHVKSVRI